MYDCAVVAICVRFEKKARKKNEHVRIMQCIISLGNIPSSLFLMKEFFKIVLCLRFSLSSGLRQQMSSFFKVCKLTSFSYAFRVDTAHCSKSSFFVQKFNFENCRFFLGEKLVKML